MGIDTTVIPTQIDVDNVTIEKTGSVISVKDGGINTDQIADGAVTTAKLTGAVPVLIATQTATASVSYLEFTDLDLSTDGIYKLYFSGFNSDVTTRKLYITGAQSLSYDIGIVTVTSGTGTGNYNSTSDSSGYVSADMVAGSYFSGEATIYLGIDNKMVINATVNAGSTNILSVSGVHSNTAGNLTNLKIGFGGATLGTGSFCAIYKIPKA